MATEIMARAKQSAPDAPDDGDYETFCAALSASARGRAFLTEYTRRNRNADTEQLLAAIAQLQETVAANSAPKVTDTIKTELRALLDEIDGAQSELAASIVATKATKLAELVALVARRITAIVASAHAERPPPAGSPSTSLAARTGRRAKGHRRARASCRRADTRAAGIADPLAGGHAAAADRTGAQRGDHGGGHVCRAATARAQRKTCISDNRRAKNRSSNSAACCRLLRARSPSNQPGRWHRSWP